MRRVCTECRVQYAHAQTVRAPRLERLQRTPELPLGFQLRAFVLRLLILARAEQRKHRVSAAAAAAASRVLMRCCRAPRGKRRGERECVDSPAPFPPQQPNFPAPF